MEKERNISEQCTQDTEKKRFTIKIQMILGVVRKETSIPSLNELTGTDVAFWKEGFSVL